MRIYSFAPIVNEHSKVLILGTMPGIRSLSLAQYYGHKGNHFWKILSELLGQQLVHNYQWKQQLLVDNHIAAWDVLKACVRETSADADIKMEEPNDIEQLLTDHPNIKAVFFNGKKAAELFQKYIGTVDIPTFTLPSTSPANAWMKYEDKKEQWARIVDYL